MTSGHADKDKNFFMWALIPYITANSGERFMDDTVTFEQAATRRPDGGHNICYASVLAPDVKPPKHFDSMLNFCGPCWNSTRDGRLTVWQTDSEWSHRRVDGTYQADVRRDLSLLALYDDGCELSADEYAYLASRGYTRTLHENGCTKTATSCVWVEGREARESLLAIGDRVRGKHQAELEKMKKRYTDAVIRATPKHLRTMQAFCQQYIFHADGWFILHCLKELVGNGKLKPPTEAQKRSLTTVIVHE